jgi:hypothetical protein
MKSIHPSPVTGGQDKRPLPRVHLLGMRMDCRVNPRIKSGDGNDVGRGSNREAALLLGDLALTDFDDVFEAK